MGVDVEPVGDVDDPVVAERGLLEARLEEGAEALLDVDDPVGVGEGQIALAVDQPAHELIALVGEEEEAELEQEVCPPPRQPAPDCGERTGHESADCKADQASGAARKSTDRRESRTGTSIQGQCPASGSATKRAPGRRRFVYAVPRRPRCRDPGFPRRPGPGSRGARVLAGGLEDLGIGRPVEGRARPGRFPASKWSQIMSTNSGGIGWRPGRARRSSALGARLASRSG